MDNAVEHQLRSIANALHKLRVQFGLNQEETIQALLKEGASVKSQGMISDWENGKRVPPAEILIAYSFAFNVDVRYIMGEIDEFLPRQIDLEIDDMDLENALNKLKKSYPTTFEEISDYIMYLIERREAIRPETI